MWGVAQFSSLHDHPEKRQEVVVALSTSIPLPSGRGSGVREADRRRCGCSLLHGLCRRIAGYGPWFIKIPRQEGIFGWGGEEYALK